MLGDPDRILKVYRNPEGDYGAGQVGKDLLDGHEVQACD